ncbi:MAG TPA: LysR family transcriptional regulator [Burkholderiales bacterium]|nr:LysR family transcriptional regulator [Burkholderiales bacterium]
MRFDLTTLKLFLAVLDEGSLAKAAGREHITAPAISKRITDLEDSLGAQLLERHSSGIRATPAGEALANEARSIFASLDRMRSRLSDYAAGRRGRVRIFSNHSAVVGSLPDHLAGFILANPMIDIQLDEHRSTDIVKGVGDGDADIGIHAPQVPADGLDIHPYQEVRLVVIAPHGHPLFGKTGMAFAEAADFDFVALSELSTIGSLVLQMAAQENIALKTRLQVTGFEALRRMVQAGMGIGVLPEFSALPYTGAMNFTCIPLSDGWARYRLSICTRPPDTLSMPARLLLAHLRNATAAAAA